LLVLKIFFEFHKNLLDASFGRGIHFNNTLPAGNPISDLHE